MLQSHPRLPIIAISGIDPTVKIFAPTTKLDKRANRLDDAETIIARNRSEEGRQSGNIMSVRARPFASPYRFKADHLADIQARQMMSLLLSRVPPDMQGRVRVALAGDDEVEGEGEDAGECVIM